jgi:Ala-tRNA(Pro) deacylase
MGIRGRLIDFLETQGIPYRERRHPPTYTAQQEASAEHLPGRRVAKVVVVMGDGRPAMFVVPADRHVDLKAARCFLRRADIRLAREDELTNIFPDCQVGTMPPFGNWYGLPVYLDDALAAEPDLTFAAGRYDESITMPTASLERFSRALVCRIAEDAHPRQTVA